MEQCKEAYSALAHTVPDLRMRRGLQPLLPSTGYSSCQSFSFRCAAHNNPPPDYAADTKQGLGQDAGARKRKWDITLMLNRIQLIRSPVDQKGGKEEPYELPRSKRLHRSHCRNRTCPVNDTAALGPKTSHQPGGLQE